ncbi:phage protein [Streptococcus pyogenes]|nr:phage protein [Streptococcus pyogenes]
MQRQYVSSSNARSVDWENNTLEVEFNNAIITM